MLVLTRQPHESIMIGETIRVRVVRIRGGSVRLAIDAPRDVRIERTEASTDERQK